MKIIAIANQKGGVGKTATAAALGSLLAIDGWRVLIVDTDPQASLTLATVGDCSGRSLAEVIGGAAAGSLALPDIVRQIRTGLDIAPADIALASCELSLVARMAREMVLSRALASVDRQYDVVLIDCPPSLGLLTVNSLAAAHGVVAPVLPAVSDLRGLQMFMQSLDQVRDINPRLELIGVLVTQFDQRVNSHQQVLEMVRGADLPILGIIPRSVRVAEASGARQMLPEYDPSGKPTAGYKDFAERIVEWLNNR